jgi:hypothetical protein
MSEYPEHEKLCKVADLSQKIGEFLDFGLAKQSLVLCEVDDESYTDTRFYPTSKSIRAILADYFEIDQKKIDEEKERMLEALRSA